MVRHEERIKPRLFQRLDETHEMLQVEVGVGVRSRIAPPGRMDGDRSHDGAKMKLLCHVERSLREFRHITRFTHVAPDRFGIFGPCGRRDPRNRPLLTQS